MINTCLESPAVEARHFFSLPNSNRQVLMPVYFPVSLGRLIEKCSADYSSLPAGNRVNKRTNDSRTRQVAKRRHNTEQISNSKITLAPSPGRVTGRNMSQLSDDTTYTFRIKHAGNNCEAFSLNLIRVVIQHYACVTA